MNKTYKLRQIIKSLLDESNGKCYPTNAPDNAQFPYKTYSIDSIQLGDDADRNDYLIYVDIFDYSTNEKVVEQIADDIEDSFNRRNNPSTDIYPTFYLAMRRSVPDQDKKIKHIQLTIQAQVYRSVNNVN